MNTNYDDESDMLEELVPSGAGTSSGDIPSGGSLELELEADIGFNPTRFERIDNKANAIDEYNAGSSKMYPSVKAVTEYVGTQVGRDVFTGATKTANGVKGQVPAPLKNTTNYKKVLCDDGTWKFPTIGLSIKQSSASDKMEMGFTVVTTDNPETTTGITFDLIQATQAMAGMMSASDKKKLDEITPISNETIDNIIV